MIIPDKIKIGANTITIERRLARDIDMEGNGGEAKWEFNTLILASDMPEDRTAVCFLHEIVHFMNTYLEEKDVTWISEGVLAVIRDNNLDFRAPQTKE